MSENTQSVPLLQKNWNVGDSYFPPPNGAKVKGLGPPAINLNN